MVAVLVDHHGMKAMQAELGPEPTTLRFKPNQLADSGQCPSVPASCALANHGHSPVPVIPRHFLVKGGVKWGVDLEPRGRS
jgi:hypothetical protein